MNTFTDEQLSKMNLEQCRMLSHRFKYPESARYLHGVAQVAANQYERAGNVCMAHAKRLQAKYWARRAFGPGDQPMEYGAPYRLRTDALRAAEIVAVSAFSP